jgi:hypothetical protein
MATKRSQRLAFEIDKLTRSIENVVTGDSFQTVVLPFTKEDLKTASRSNGWLFNWKQESAMRGRLVFKLTIVENPAIIQGLVSLEVKADHIAMQLVESAPFNLGRNKIYAGVLGNLVAFCCKRSFELGFAGNLAFIAKTRLIGHYEDTLKAVHVGSGRMVIETAAAQYLVDKYFPG